MTRFARAAATRGSYSEAVSRRRRSTAPVAWDGSTEVPTRSSYALAARMIRLDSGGGGWGRGAGPAGAGRPAPDGRYRVEHAGLLDDFRTVLRDAPLVLGRHQDRGPAGNRVAQRQLPDIVHQRPVLKLKQRRLRHAELPPDGHREPAHPGRVPRLNVPADLCDPRERPYGLQVGGPDPGVPPQCYLGDEQRSSEHGDRGEPHDLGGE